MLFSTAAVRCSTWAPLRRCLGHGLRHQFQRAGGGRHQQWRFSLQRRIDDQPERSRAGTAFGINDSGLVVGTRNTGSSGQAYTYNIGSATLTTLTCSTGSSQGYAVNAEGTVAASTGGSESQIAATYAAGASGYSYAGLLPGGTESFPMAINSLGHVTGWGTANGQSVPQAFFSNGTGTPIDLGMLGSDTSSFGWGINGQDEVVGESSPGSNDRGTALFWSSGTGTIPLSTLVLNLGGRMLNVARAISANGQYIAGWGTNATGANDAFLLTALLPGDANREAEWTSTT